MLRYFAFVVKPAFPENTCYSETMSGELVRAKQLASRPGQWDQRIVEITTTGEDKSQSICRFAMEPEGDAQGCFWITNLLTRVEFELEVEAPFDPGFQIGDRVYLPNGRILNNQIRSVIDKTYPLEKTAEAHHYVERWKN